MIVNGFDNRNVIFTADGIEIKVFMSILSQATPSQAKKASDLLIKSGFDISPTDVSLLVQSAVVQTRRLCNSIDVSKDIELEEVAEADEEQAEEKPVTVH